MPIHFKFASVLVILQCLKWCIQETISAQHAELVHGFFFLV